jgi:TolB protein
MEKIRPICVFAALCLGALAFAVPASAAWPGRDGPVLYRGFESALGEEDTEPRGLRGFSFAPFGHISDYTNLRGDRDPQASAHGDRAVFTSTDRPSQTKGISAIYVQHLRGTGDVQGGGARRIVGGQHGFTAREATFAPSGRRILFVGSTGGGDIYSVRLDGGGLHRITHGPARDAAPSFSPRGRQIIFQRTPAGASSAHVFSARPDGSRPRDLTPDLGGAGTASDPDFSPDGRTIAFATALGSQSRLWTMRADGSHRRALAVPAAGGYSLAEPAFSPSGNWLLAVAARADELRLIRVPMTGSGQPRLLPPEFSGDSPVWARRTR